MALDSRRDLDVATSLKDLTPQDIAEDYRRLRDKIEEDTLRLL